MTEQTIWRILDAYKSGSDVEIARVVRMGKGAPLYAHRFKVDSLYSLFTHLRSTVEIGKSFMYQWFIDGVEVQDD